MADTPDTAQRLAEIRAMGDYLMQYEASTDEYRQAAAALLELLAVIDERDARIAELTAQLDDLRSAIDDRHAAPFPQVLIDELDALAPSPIEVYETGGS